MWVYHYPCVLRVSSDHPNYLYSNKRLLTTKEYHSSNVRTMYDIPMSMYVPCMTFQCLCKYHVWHSNVYVRTMYDIPMSMYVPCMTFQCICTYHVWHSNVYVRTMYDMCTFISTLRYDYTLWDSLTISWTLNNNSVIRNMVEQESRYQIYLSVCEPNRNDF